MDKAEHAIFCERMRALARETLYVWLVNVLRTQYQLAPAEQRSRSLAAIQAKLRATREDYASMAMSWETPEMSDLKSAEFQEAFDVLSKELYEALAGGAPLSLHK